MNFTKKRMCFAPCVNGDTFLCYLGSIHSFEYYRHTIPQEGRMVTALRLLALLGQITSNPVFTLGQHATWLYACRRQFKIKMPRLNRGRTKNILRCGTLKSFDNSVFMNRTIDVQHIGMGRRVPVLVKAAGLI